jgi:hypothetical protein
MVKNLQRDTNNHNLILLIQSRDGGTEWGPNYALHIFARPFRILDLATSINQGAIHKQCRQFLTIFDPSPIHIDPYRPSNALPPKRHRQFVIFDSPPPTLQLMCAIWVSFCS